MGSCSIIVVLVFAEALAYCTNGTAWGSELGAEQSGDVAMVRSHFDIRAVGMIEIQNAIRWAAACTDEK